MENCRIMFSTEEALSGWEHDRYGPFIKIGDIEIRLEPLLYDDQFYLAIYKNENLVAPKVVFKPGFVRGENK